MSAAAITAAIACNQDEEHVVIQLGRIDGAWAGLYCLIDMIKDSELETLDQWATLIADMPNLLKSWPTLPVPELLHGLTAIVGGSANQYRRAYVLASAGVIEWAHARRKASTTEATLGQIVTLRDNVFSRLRLDPELRGPQRTAAFWRLVRSTSAKIARVM